MKLIGYKLVFVWKRNENNEILKYKTRLVAQYFLQKLSINYDETYSFVVDVITLWYFISLVVREKNGIRLIDVVVAYLYESFDNDIYIKISERFSMPEVYKSGHRENYTIKL
jgi:hypothetical protein